MNKEIRSFSITIIAISILTLSVTTSNSQTLKREVAGPLVGSVSQSEARILYRNGDRSQELKIVVTGSNGSRLEKAVTTLKENDFVAKFHLNGLQPNTRYTYSIVDRSNQKTLSNDKTYAFSTLPDHRNNKFKAAIVSCVNETTRDVWKEIGGLDVDMLCLNGDTPYIDSTSLAVARRKHRKLLQMPELDKLVANTSTLGNWDDHDFGANNANGLSFSKHKHKTLTAFKNYRANASFGLNDQQGIYHKSDHGVIEFFHLDQRYFAQTEPSPVDGTQPSCFGKQQWQWLLKSLKESKATFKVLSIGAIWEDKKNRETDDMFTYWYERDALFDFIKKEKIAGVVLVGGDIHLSRHLIHAKRVGYDLHDFVMSPGHNETIKTLDVFHPSLEWSLVEPHQFLVISADGTKKIPQLTIQYRQPGGKVNREIRLNLDQLSPKEGTGLARDLKGSWNFDEDFDNRSNYKDRLGAKPVNGAKLVKNGWKGRAVSFKREQSQYLNIGRSVLDETSKKFTVSLWVKPVSLPGHGSKERFFVYESTAEGMESLKPAYCLSLGLRSAKDPNQVILELFTHTVKPAENTGRAPTAISQGGFRYVVPRNLVLKKWSHIVTTFNSDSFELFLNGKSLGKRKVQNPGPCSEHGGLIIGGHRNGTGRNFEGYIDEFAIWGRILTEKEIRQLGAK